MLRGSLLRRKLCHPARLSAQPDRQNLETAFATPMGGGAKYIDLDAGAELRSLSSAPPSR